MTKEEDLPQEEPTGDRWISVADRPLVTEEDGLYYITADGEQEFIAAVEYQDKNRPGERLWWIRHCIIDQESFNLCVVGDDWNEPAGWEFEAIQYWQPWVSAPGSPAPVEEPITVEALEKEPGFVKNEFGDFRNGRIYAVFSNGKFDHVEITTTMGKYATVALKVTTMPQLRNLIELIG